MTLPIKDTALSPRDGNSVVRSNSEAQTDETRYLRAGLEIYQDWQAAYDFFNVALCDNRLPDAIITRTPRKHATEECLRVFLT